MNKILDILIPRFIEEDVALMFDGKDYQMICSVKDLEPHEKPDAVVTFQTFNFFGLWLFPKQIGEICKV